MRRGLPVAGLLLLLPASLLAQTAASRQIDAVYAAQQQQEDAYHAAQAAQQEQEQHGRQVEQHRVLAQAAAVAVHERARITAARANEGREQTYQDQVRSLEIEQQKLVMQAERGLVARENEYIDRDLAQKTADTDVTKSEADATRNLSIGARTFLEKTGEASANAASVGTKMKESPAVKTANRVN